VDPVFPEWSQLLKKGLGWGEGMRAHGAAILVQVDVDPGGDGAENLVARPYFWATRGVQIRHEEGSHVPGHYKWVDE
jgi:hypothetical protein